MRLKRPCRDLNSRELISNSVLLVKRKSQHHTWLVATVDCWKLALLESSITHSVNTVGKVAKVLKILTSFANPKKFDFGCQSIYSSFLRCNCIFSTSLVGAGMDLNPICSIFC